MTVIAVRKTNDKIIIASDSQQTRRDNKTLDASKIIKYNNCIAGCAGNSLDIALFAMFLRTHIPKGSTDEDIIDFLSEFVDWKQKKTKEGDYVSSIILITDNRIFNIYKYAILNTDKEFTAIGSGMFCALGAMKMGAMPKKAVETAIEYDLYCGGDIQEEIVTINK